MRKAWFDISQSDEKNVSQANDYIIRNAFLITVQIRSIGVSHDITDAQRRLDRAFGQYHASQLRRHCFTGGKVTRRNKKFQPMAFLAFNIEGSRQNGFHTDTIYPHGHGAALFHEKTLENFKDRHHQFLTPEGGYKIPNPSLRPELFYSLYVFVETRNHTPDHPLKLQAEQIQTTLRCQELENTQRE